MSSPEAAISFRDHLSHLGFSKLMKAMILAAFVALLIVLLNVFFSSKKIFETQLEAATNIYRTQILAGDLKRSQLVLEEILGVNGRTRVHFMDGEGQEILPSLNREDMSSDWNVVRTQVPVYFDSHQKSLFAYVHAEQKVAMNWFLFATMFIALLICQGISGYLFSSALREVGQDLGEKLKKMGAPQTEGSGSDHLPILELNEISNSINQMQKKLTEVQTTFKSPDELRRFAHDIRSPLSAISLALGTIDNLPAPARRLMDNAFFRMSSMATGLLNAEVSPLASLAQALENVVAEKQTEHAQRSLRWDLALDGDVQISAGQIVELSRSISNLLNNAAEASPNHGLIIVKARLSKDLIRVEVLDQGNGIPHELTERILKGGYSTKAHGHGIGLSSTQRLVSNWGGQLKLQNQIEGGLLVELTIPVKAIA